VIELARHRLEVLIADTVTERERELRRITAAERTDLIVILSELHRLHLAVSEQRKTLQTIADRKRRVTARKQPPLKPVGARSRRPTTQNASGKR
jgi:hypothetical protein